MSEAAGAEAAGPSRGGFERSRTWTVLLPASVLLIGFVLFFAGLRLARSDSVFYYTEGPVLGSLAALQIEGDLAALYPNDGWQEPPTVLTLYPPTFFLIAAAADAVAGTAARSGSFVGLRLVGLASLAGVLALLAAFARRRRVPVSWLLALVAAAMLTPGVYTVVGAAQADVTALLWTWVGIAALGGPGRRESPGDGRLSGAGIAFLLAFFTKQSYVAAPVALVAVLWLSGRRARAAVLTIVLACAALGGIALLDLATAGGYTANTIDALTGGVLWANLTSTVRASEPVQWIPLALAAVVAVRGRLRIGFPELYLGLATALHTAAMVKTGSSVNYLLEPTFALVLLAVWRCPGRAPESGTPAALRKEPSRISPVVGALLAVAVLAPAVRAAHGELGVVRAWIALREPVRMAEYEGHPLTDVYFFPAALKRGGRPWLNDPFAFGALYEAGAWDPAPLVADLEARVVPFALTMVDLGPAPAPDELGSRELVMAYFWRSPPIWTALTGHYRRLGPGRLSVWLPDRDEEVRP